QDRLVTELRIARVSDVRRANRLLGRFIARFNERFAVPAANPDPAWRAAPAAASLEAICSLKYHRVVAGDHTVRVGSTVLQLPGVGGGRGYAGRRVEIQQRLDGRLVVWDGQRQLLVQPAPADARQLRALASAHVELGHTAPSVGSQANAHHPWHQVQRGSKLWKLKQQQGLTDSLSS